MYRHENRWELKHSRAWPLKGRANRDAKGKPYKKNGKVTIRLELVTKVA